MAIIILILLHKIQIDQTDVVQMQLNKLHTIIIINIILVIRIVTRTIIITTTTTTTTIIIIVLNDSETNHNNNSNCNYHHRSNKENYYINSTALQYSDVALQMIFDYHNTALRRLYVHISQTFT